jgi:hypothetical protein
MLAFTKEFNGALSGLSNVVTTRQWTSPGIETCKGTKGKAISVNRPWRPIGLRQSTHKWRWVSLVHRPPFIKIPGTHFWWRLSRPQGHSAAGRIRSIEKSSVLFWSRTRDHPACSMVPQPTTVSRATIETCSVLKRRRYIPRKEKKETSSETRDPQRRVVMKLRILTGSW